MSGPSEPSRRYRIIALFCGAGVALLGATVLAGWLLHNEALTTIIRGANIPIKPNIATGMLLCGTALALLSPKTLTNPIRFGTAALATMVIALSTLTVAEFLLGWNLGIDQSLMGKVSATPGIPHPGRMPPLAALCFALVGVALFTASRLVQKRLRLPLVGGLGGILMTAGGVPLFGFFLEMLFGPGWNYMGMSASSVAGALAFLLLGIGLLALLRGHAHLAWSLDRLTTAGFAAGFMLIFLASGLFHSFALRVNEAETQVSHARQVLMEIEEIEANMSDLETEQRSYIITGDERLLDEWDLQKLEVRAHVGKLQKLAAKNSHQQPCIRQLATLAAERIDWAEQTIATRREKGFPAARELIASGTGLRLVAQSRELVKEIESDEHRRLDQRQSDSDVSSQRASQMLPMGVLFCCAILSLGLFFLNSGMGERKQAEEKYRSIFDNASEGIFQSTPDGVFISVNPAFARLLGFASPEELIREHDYIQQQSYADPTKRQEVKRLLEESGVLNDFEFEVKRKDGSTIWVSENVRIVRGTAGGAAYYEGSVQDITERKRAEEAVGESERRFRFLNELGDATRPLTQPREIMATVTRLLGTHLHVSRCAYAEVEEDGDHFTVPDDYTDGCASIAGKYRLADFGEQTHSLLVAGRTVMLRDINAELAPGKGADAFEAIAIKAMIACPLIKNGKLLAAMAVHHLAPRCWTNGEIALVQEVVERCWSIIERARAELVLRENEEYLRLVIAASNDGIWEYDFFTDTLTWSDRVYDMFGLDRSSFIPTLKSFTTLLHPNDRAAFQKAVPEQMANGIRYQAHARILRGDGSYGHFLRRGRTVLDATGKPTRMVGSFADLTILFLAEQKLVEQANLLNLAQDAIMVRDMDDRIEFWNHGAEVLYGWTAEEARGRLTGDLIRYEEPIKTLAERILLETGAWSGECSHLTKEGDTVVVRSRWTLVRDEHGQPKSKLIIATDMTEQKKIEEQFLRAQRLESIGTLASGVAHDLNNVLLPIMMAAPVLRNEIDPVERDKFLDIVETSAQRGADIIKQVLTFARGADGDRTLLQPIYLLEEVSKIASQTFPKSISLRTGYEENIRLLEVDSTQIHQVLLNLCINARDAMPDGGELFLRAENFDIDEQYARTMPGASAGPHVMLEVTDTGSGIPKQVLDKIFDPFFTTKGIGKGTGLGLSTVAGIVRSHGGFIDLNSQPGHTSFKIFLPAKSTLDTSIVLEASTMVPRGNGQIILLVDDEPSIRDVAKIILESHGYKVLVAEDGATALALFAQQMGRIAVVVSDLAMPGMDGLMLVRTLRQIEPGIKIIVSTGQADDSRAAEITALNVDGCLTKPHTARSLLLKLSHVLQSGLKDAA